MTRFVRNFLLASAGLASVSCGSLSPTCTLIGCGDSITVTLQPTMGLPYRATLSFPQGETVTFRCTSTGVPDAVQEGLASIWCTPGSFMVMCQGAPDYCSTSPVTLAVVGPDGNERSGVVTPSYSVSQPNGPRCGPTCTSGKATLP